jgi:hypothetical protein
MVFVDQLAIEVRRQQTSPLPLLRYEINSGWVYMIINIKMNTFVGNFTDVII